MLWVVSHIVFNETEKRVGIVNFFSCITKILIENLKDDNHI